MAAKNALSRQSSASASPFEERIHQEINKSKSWRSPSAPEVISTYLNCGDKLPPNLCLVRFLVASGISQDPKQAVPEIVIESTKHLLTTLIARRAGSLEPRLLRKTIIRYGLNTQVYFAPLLERDIRFKNVYESNAALALTSAPFMDLESNQRARYVKYLSKRVMNLSDFVLQNLSVWTPTPAKETFAFLYAERAAKDGDPEPGRGKNLEDMYSRAIAGLSHGDYLSIWARDALWLHYTRQPTSESLRYFDIIWLAAQDIKGKSLIHSDISTRERNKLMQRLLVSALDQPQHLKSAIKTMSRSFSSEKRRRPTSSETLHHYLKCWTSSKACSPPDSRKVLKYFSNQSSDGLLESSTLTGIIPQLRVRIRIGSPTRVLGRHRLSPCS